MEMHEWNNIRIESKRTGPKRKTARQKIHNRGNDRNKIYRYLGNIPVRSISNSTITVTRFILDR